MTVARIKRGDAVVARAGADAGKTGKVLQVISGSDRALVEGLNIVKKTLRKTQDNPQGGIVDKEGPIALSKLMLYCPTCKKGVRISRIRDGEKTIRKCSKCSHAFDG